MPPGARGTARSATDAPGTRRRADAVRNRAAIIEATIATLRADPDASVARIAEAAGVGRVTLYGHFSTRAELIDAALVDVLDRGNRVLDGLVLDGDPVAALDRLVDTSWALLDESRSVLAAAQRELPPGRIRGLHEALEGRVRSLLERGRHEGVFRTDLPVAWMLATMHALIHGAADEIAAGRLAPAEAAPLLQTTLRAAYASRPGA